MGKYAGAMAKTGLSMPGPGMCPAESQIPELLRLTHDPDPRVRRLALKHLCPCRLQRERQPVWNRVFEMADDPDPGVRMDAVHAMTDGSPREYFNEVLAVIERMQNDPDAKVRRYIRRTLSAVRRTGRVNVN